MYDAVFWIAQAVGLGALLFSVLAYQGKTRMQILNRQSLGSLIYVLHFAMLSAWTGAVLNGIIVIRNWVFSKKDSEKWASHPAWIVVFIALSAFSLFFTWEGYISLLPLMSNILGVYARWQEKASHIRLIVLVGVALWLPYTIAVHSYAGTATQILIGVAILFGMWRHDRKNGTFRVPEI